MSDDQDYDRRPERSLVTSSEDGRAVEIADTVRGWWLRFGENLGDGEFCNQRAEEWVTNGQAEAIAAIFLSGRQLVQAPAHLPEQEQAMKARLDPECSPNKYGGYHIINGYGDHLLWVHRTCFGPETKQMAERIVAAINGELVQAPLLPEGWDGPLPELGWWATGMWLKKHDLDGKAWERWSYGEWWTDHRSASDGMRYIIRPVTPAAPPQPLTEEVYWWEAVERGLAVIARDGEYVMDCSGGDVIAYRDGDRWALMYDDASHEQSKRPLASPDGKVTVLVEDGA